MAVVIKGIYAGNRFRVRAVGSAEKLRAKEWGPWLSLSEVTSDPGTGGVILGKVHQRGQESLFHHLPEAGWLEVEMMTRQQPSPTHYTVRTFRCMVEGKRWLPFALAGDIGVAVDRVMYAFVRDYKVSECELPCAEFMTDDAQNDRTAM